MLSEFRIRKLVSSQHFSQLLDELAHNGRPIGLSVQLRLSDPENLTIASIGLAIQRMTEITFAANQTTSDLIRLLLHAQHSDGGFGSIAGSAIALHALFDARSQCGVASMLQHDIDRAIGPVLMWLAQRQRASGVIGDAIDASICRWQLGRCDAFRVAIRWHDFVEATEAMPVSRDTAPLIELAA